VFIFELKVVNVKELEIPPLQINEFQFAVLLRILKSRNKELYNLFNSYYDKISEAVV